MNTTVAISPFVITELIVNALSPALECRARISAYESKEFRASGWDLECAGEKITLLEAAREERKATARISLWVPEVEPNESESK